LLFLLFLRAFLIDLMFLFRVVIALGYGEDLRCEVLIFGIFFLREVMIICLKVSQVGEVRLEHLRSVS
jgi:hypothetical protein